MTAPPTIGRLQVERQLGSGGFATVWLARDTELDSLVAVKILSDNWGTHEDIRRRFIDEARLLRRVDSDHLVRVYDIGALADGRPYFVMTYADGGSLAERLETSPAPWPAHTVADLVDALAVGLTVLHRHHVIHRDVKPRNVLLRSTPSGVMRPLLGDLGIAKDLQWATGMTMPAGSNGYMPPEQRGFSADIGPASDVYALALTTARMLGLDRPWPPTPLGQVLDRATKDHPGERTSSAAVFARDLRHALAPWLHTPPAAPLPAAPRTAAPPLPAAPPPAAPPPAATAVLRRGPARRRILGGLALLLSGAGIWWQSGVGAATRTLTPADGRTAVQVPRSWQDTADVPFPGSSDPDAGARAGADGRSVSVAFEPSYYSPDEVLAELDLSDCHDPTSRSVTLGSWSGTTWHADHCPGGTSLDEVVVGNPGDEEWTVWLEVRSRGGQPDLETVLESLDISP